jgi:hypothetical protein
MPQIATMGRGVESDATSEAMTLRVVTRQVERREANGRAMRKGERDRNESA